MQNYFRRFLKTLLLGLAVGTAGTTSALHAADERGFDATIQSVATGQEIAAQGNLWVMEVSFKPVRVIALELTNPKTGKKEKSHVWYVVYKAVNRPLARLTEKAANVPVNVEDAAPKLLFAPEVTLVSDDNGVRRVYQDSILPEALKAIRQREERKGGGIVLKNSVDIVGEVPAPTPLDAKIDNAVYGVAMWKDVDPEADFFTIYFSGFSNGYKLVKAPDGKEIAVRKTIMMKFRRPGDRFNINEGEILREGEPVWIDRPDDIPLLPAKPAAATPAATETK